MTALRFLIDENLSPALVGPARVRGFEAMHVNHLACVPKRIGTCSGLSLNRTGFW